MNFYKLLSEPDGIGEVKIGETRKPEYDIDETEMSETVERIMRGFNDTNNNSNTCSDIFIRYHYKTSAETIILYTFNGEQYYAYADLNGDRIYKPFPVDDDSRRYYASQLISCSYKVEQ